MLDSLRKCFLNVTGQGKAENHHARHWLSTVNKLVFSIAAATLSLSASCLLTTTTKQCHSFTEAPHTTIQQNVRNRLI